MSEWRDPLPEPETDLIEPPTDTDFEPDPDELEDEDIPLVDATENRP